MPTATFVQEGNTVDYTPDSAVASGDVIVQNALVGVAPFPIAANELGAIAVAGVFDFPKATGSGTAIAAGVECNWDALNKEAYERTDGEGSEGADKLLGKSVAAAGEDDTTVRVRLHQ